MELRAFRGTRRRSVYHAHSVGDEAFARIRVAAERDGLPLLGSLEPRELDKQEARQLAEELGVIRASLELPELDAELTALADVARWCSRAPGDAWLRVE